MFGRMWVINFWNEIAIYILYIKQVMAVLTVRRKQCNISAILEANKNIPNKNIFEFPDWSKARIISVSYKKYFSLSFKFNQFILEYYVNIKANRW